MDAWRKDHLVPFSVGEEHLKIFEDGLWPITKIKHHKGHMVDISKMDELARSIQSMT